MEVNKASWEKSAWYLAYRDLADTRASGYFGNLKKKGINPNLKVPQVKSDGKYLAWTFSFKRLLKVQSGDFLRKIPAKQI